MLQLQIKKALWEEVASLLTKGVMETVQLLQDQRVLYSHYFLTTKCTGEFQPMGNLSVLSM